METEKVTDTTDNDVVVTDTHDDLKIENDALKQLLTESKTAIDALKEEIKSVKTTNAKLLNQLSVTKEKPTLEAMLNGFNKYKK